MEICLLYHSGVGGTRTVAQVIAENLSKNQDILIKMCSVEEDDAIIWAEKYTNIIFGFPVYHGAASKSMMEFLGKMPKSIKPRKVYVFATCGLYPANAIRDFAIACRKKNLWVVGSMSCRAPATDGTLYAPKMKIFSAFEKGFGLRVNRVCEEILSLFKQETIADKLPPFRFHAILNYPNQKMGERFHPTIYTIKNKCVGCGKCVKECFHGCIQMDENKIAVHSLQGCEHCMRCIHNCPKGALSLRKGKSPQLQLTASFYEEEYKRLSQDLGMEENG